MRRHTPDFFLHSGDTIYADGVIKDEVELATAQIGQQGPDPTKAQGRRDARRIPRGKYNLMDEHLRAFNAEVPTFFQWDDHEVTEQLVGLEGPSDAATPEVGGACSPPAPARAFHEMTPIRYSRPSPAGSIARSPTGRCSTCSSSTCAAYRGPNGPEPGRDADGPTRILGPERAGPG